MKKIGIIAANESIYLKKIVNKLCNFGYPPQYVFLGSSIERLCFKMRSIKRIYLLHGLLEIFWRLWDREKMNFKNEKLISLPEYNNKHIFKIIYYDHLKSGQIYLNIKKAKLDLLILAGCGILPKIIIDTVKMTINCHPAILPGARGIDVVEWSLINNLPLGNTIHIVTSNVDSGPILRYEKIYINKNESYKEFKNRLFEKQVDLLINTVIELCNGNSIKQIPNNISKSKLFFATNHKNRKQAYQKFTQL